MKLDALDGHCPVTQPHDGAVGCLGRNIQFVRKARTVNHQRVIARGVEVLGQSPKYRPAVVTNRTRFAVHQLRCMSDLRSEDLADSLDRKSTRLNSSHVAISYAVFCLKKKKRTHKLN